MFALIRVLSSSWTFCWMVSSLSVLSFSYRLLLLVLLTEIRVLTCVEAWLKGCWCHMTHVSGWSPQYHWIQRGDRPAGVEDDDETDSGQ